MSKKTDLVITQYQSDIQANYNNNKAFLSQLPKLDLRSETDLNHLNKWVIHNQRKHKILDILVLNILPGLLTLGTFHLFYYLVTTIINFIKFVFLSEYVSFHSNWTDHLTPFKKSQKAVNRIKGIQKELLSDLDETEMSSESVDGSQTHSSSESESESQSASHASHQESNPKSTEEEQKDPFEDFPEDKYPLLFKFLSLDALGKFAQTSHYNQSAVLKYLPYFDINTPIRLPKETEITEALIQYVLEKSYTKLFIAIIRHCNEPLLSKYLHPWLEKAAEENDFDSIKMILSLVDPLTGGKFFDVNTPISNEESILTIATRKGLVKITRLCIENGATLFRSGRRQLGFAICSKNTECVKIILELLAVKYGKNKDLKGFLNTARMHGIFAYELTALSEAIDHSTVEIAQLLIDFGCDVNQDDHRGCPMKRALNTRNADMFLLLLRNDYDIKKHENFRKFMLINFAYTTSHTSEWKKMQNEHAIEMLKALSSIIDDMKKDHIDLPKSLTETPEERSKKVIQEIVIWSEGILAITENDKHPNIIFLRDFVLRDTPPTAQSTPNP